MHEAVTSFFDANGSWPEKVLEEGRADGTLRIAGSARDSARVIIACLEGATLVARTYADVERFSSVTASLLAGLAG